MTIPILRKSKVFLLFLSVILIIVISGCNDKPKESDNKDADTTEQETNKQETSKEDDESTNPVVNNEEQYAMLLKPEEVGEIGGLTDVKIVEKDSMIGAGGDVNFAAGSDLVLILQIQDKSFYTTMKAGVFYKQDLPGIGDEAFWGSSGMNDSLNGLVFRKEDMTVSIIGFYDMNNNNIPFLSQDQLLELANLVLSRL